MKALHHVLLFFFIFFGSILMLPGLLTKPKKSWKALSEGYKARREMIKQKGTFL